MHGNTEQAGDALEKETAEWINPESLPPLGHVKERLQERNV